MCKKKVEIFVNVSLCVFFIGYSCTFIQVDSYEKNNCLLFNIIKSENLS